MDTENTQKQPGCKRCSLVQNGQGEKSCKIKGGSQEMAVMYRLMVKNLITAIQVNMCCLIPCSFTRISTKFT